MSTKYYSLLLLYFYFQLFIILFFYYYSQYIIHFQTVFLRLEKIEYLLFVEVILKSLKGFIVQTHFTATNTVVATLAMTGGVSAVTASVQTI